MNEQEFKDQYILTFMANWASANYGDACRRGEHKMLTSLSMIEEAAELANQTWENFAGTETPSSYQGPILPKMKSAEDWLFEDLGTGRTRWRDIDDAWPREEALKLIREIQLDAVASERESCAKLVDEAGSYEASDRGREALEDMAETIRNQKEDF